MSLRQIFQPTVLLSIALMMVIVMMVLPVPSWFLDFGLTASFALAILLFTVTLFIERPLDFSAFPTILLAGLLLRLSLNVSSTKLIIGDGHTGTDAAGGIIEGFAMFIMGGNVFMGIVIFGVLLIVNFMVINKGAGRMAEVGARFALDAMPGKQLAIDADVASGALSHEEATERRRIEQEETTFFGSLDGASKFVKGDAVAGLLITLLNILVGLAVGVGVHGLSFTDAINTYAVLTVGDGLVNQIPAVITSVGAALLLSKGGAQGAIDKTLLKQLGGHPMALWTVAGLLTVLAAFPGLPVMPFLVGAGILGFSGWRQFQSQKAEELAVPDEPETEVPKEQSLGDLLDLDDIQIEVARDIVGTLLSATDGIDSRIVNIRKHIVKEYGFILPSVRLTDDPALPDGDYVVKVHGVEAARSTISPGCVMVLLREDIPFDCPGKDFKEPVYDAPARWVSRSEAARAEGLGLTVIEPSEFATTHLLEIVKDNLGRLLTRRTLRAILDEFLAPNNADRAAANKRLLDEYVPDKVPIDLLQSVLRLMLEERTSIRNLPVILEAIGEGKSMHPTPEAICEYVRQRLGQQLVSDLVSTDGAVPLLQLAPEWEELFEAHEIQNQNGVDVALPPQEFNRLGRAIVEKINSAAQDGIYPALIASTKRRRFLRMVMDAKHIRNPVLSFEEFGTRIKPSLVGVVPA